VYYCLSGTTYDVITLFICIIQNKYLYNEKRHSRKENAILLYNATAPYHPVNPTTSLFNTATYYMASSASGKMNQIARCDWLPERARCSHLARSGLPAVSRMKNFPESHIINPLLTKFVRSRWLDIGLVR